MSIGLLQLVERHSPFDNDEAAARERFIYFLRQVAPEVAFGRELEGEADWWGHVTASAWVVNARRDHVVLVHHAKLGIWVQPGGHCDGENQPMQVALREVREETGLDVSPVSEEIFDLDVHAIPEYWNTPRHFHYDVRFLFEAQDGADLVVSPESHAVRWAGLGEVSGLNDEASLARMLAKTLAMKG